MQELDFEANIAQGLAQWKSEDEIWGDITYAMRQVLKEMLEGLLEAERDRLVACSWYGRSPERRDERAGYRTRSIVTALGKISGLRVPRTRRARFQTRLWKRYKRRAAPIEVAVMESFVCGVATRKVKRALRSVLGNDGPSHQTVSRIVAGLNRSLKKWQRRPIDDDIEILYLDGVFLRIKERGIKKRPTLFAMGITTDGRMRILGFHHAWQESADEWHAFCQTLYERGLKGSALKLVVADQAGAIASAASLLWPEAALQSCVFHKMKNLVEGLRRGPLKKAIIADAKAIYRASSRAQAIKRIALFRNRWARACPAAVRNFIKNIDLTLSYFSMPKHMWTRVRTTNPLERFFEEVKRRTRTMGAFRDRQSASRILYAIADTYNQNREQDEAREHPDKTKLNHFRTLLVA